MSGQTVVLLHAFPCDGRMWSAQADALSAAGWDVIVPDLPGFGGSDLLDAEPSLDAVADVVLHELAAQGVDRAVVGGLSLGGYLAMAMLREAPEVFAAVMLCDTKASADAGQAVDNRERLARSVLQAPDQVGRILRQSVLPGLLGPTSFASRPSVVARVERWLDDAAADTVAWYQRAMAARPASFGTLALLDVPTLVLWGDEDALSTPDDHQAMLEVLRRGQGATISGSGHLAAVEDPAGVSAVMVDFLEGVRPPFV